MRHIAAVPEQHMTWGICRNHCALIVVAFWANRRYVTGDALVTGGHHASWLIRQGPKVDGLSPFVLQNFPPFWMKGHRCTAKKETRRYTERVQEKLSVLHRFRNMLAAVNLFFIPLGHVRAARIRHTPVSKNSVTICHGHIKIPM